MCLDLHIRDLHSFGKEWMKSPNEGVTLINLGNCPRLNQTIGPSRSVLSTQMGSKHLSRVSAGFHLTVLLPTSWRYHDWTSCLPGTSTKLELWCYPQEDEGAFKEKIQRWSEPGKHCLDIFGFRLILHFPYWWQNMSKREKYIRTSLGGDTKAPISPLENTIVMNMNSNNEHAVLIREMQDYEWQLKQRWMRVQKLRGRWRKNLHPSIAQSKGKWNLFWWFVCLFASFTCQSADRMMHCFTKTIAKACWCQGIQIIE